MELLFSGADVGILDALKFVNSNNDNNKPTVSSVPQHWHHYERVDAHGHKLLVSIQGGPKNGATDSWP